MAGTRIKNGLSAREKEVAGLLMQGVSNKEIALALGVELVTVKKHVGNICRKLGARNRTQAAVVLVDEAGSLPAQDREGAELFQHGDDGV